MRKPNQIESSQRQNQYWNIFILFYLILSIALLTLDPYQFQPFVPSEQWIWEFTLQDFTRNVLFFSPFGLVVRHLFRKSHGFSLVVGLLLSFSVETTQLFLPIRASNFSDLLSNSTGTLLGSLFHQWAFANSLPGAVGVPFAFMLMPLCWTIALRADTEPVAALAIVPYLSAGLVLLHSLPPTSPIRSLKKTLIIVLWCIVALLPLVSVFHFIGFVFVAAIPLALRQIRQLSPLAKRHLIASALLSGFVFAVLLNSCWYLTTPDPVWKPDDPIWNLRPSFRLVEILLSSIIALSSRFLIEQMPEMGPSQQPVR